MAYGVREWLRPRKLVEAVYGCLRIVSESFWRGATLDSVSYVCNKKESTGTVCIPLSKIHNYETIAGSNSAGGVVAKVGGVVAGNTTDRWHINGLPSGIALLGKSADSVNCMLVGQDFVETDNGYTAFKNPAEFGVIKHPALGEPTISFYYAGGEPSSADNRFNISYPGVFNIFVKKIIDSIRLSAFGLGLADGKIAAIASGRNCVLEDSKLLRVWSEGGVTVGQTTGMLLFASTEDTIKYSEGDVIPQGCSLLGGGNPVLYKLQTAPEQQSLQSMLESWSSHIAGSGVLQRAKTEGVSNLWSGKSKQGNVKWFLYSPSKDNPYMDIYKNEMYASYLAEKIRALGGCIARDNSDNKNVKTRVIGCTPKSGDYLHGVAYLDSTETYVLYVQHLTKPEMLVANGDIIIS